VAYNALRMARNEIQAIHHIASDHVMAAQPWIEKEQIVLSPAHPTPDILRRRGRRRRERRLPERHNLPAATRAMPVLQGGGAAPIDQFTERLKSWTNKGGDNELDNYAAFWE